MKPSFWRAIATLIGALCGALLVAACNGDDRELADELLRSEPPDDALPGEFVVLGTLDGDFESPLHNNDGVMYELYDGDERPPHGILGVVVFSHSGAARSYFENQRDADAVAGIVDPDLEQSAPFTPPDNGDVFCVDILPEEEVDAMGRVCAVVAGRTVVFSELWAQPDEDIRPVGIQIALLDAGVEHVNRLAAEEE